MLMSKAGKMGQEDRPRSQPFWRKGNGKLVENRIKEDKQLIASGLTASKKASGVLPVGARTLSNQPKVSGFILGTG